MEYSAILHGNVLAPTGILPDSTLYIKGSRIDAIAEFAQRDISAQAKEFSARGYLIAPGYIDTHTHGGSGYDFLSSNPDETDAILAWLATSGVTSVVATLATAPLEEQLKAIKKLHAASLRRPPGAQIIGIHLEGPYISAEKRGAQAEHAIRPPSMDEVKELLAAGNGLIKLVTLAPELPGAMDLIEYLIDQDIVVSLGHSTASYDQAMQAADAGLNRAAHLFNGMTAFHHRQPGGVGAVLTRDDIFAELIVDGIHLHPAVVQVVLRSKGLERVVLISDAIAAAGAGDGDYVGLGGQKISVRNGAARLESGALAGSTLTMDQAVRNAVQLLGLSSEQAIKIATQTAAESLGYQTQATKGIISPGKDADLIVLDDNLKVLMTMVAGEIVYQDPDKTFMWEA